ncbi:MAG: SpoIIE family protein phosphatase [Brevinematales bacterium]|nr:SpoIIE family protein phosphatase [Brevinematales bacterium]
MMWLNLFFAIVSTFLILFLLDYIKNVYKTEVLLEQLFDQFLRLEARATYAEQEMYEYLGGRLGKAFFTQNCLVYVRAKEKFFLKYQAMPHPLWPKLLRRNLALQEDPAILGRDITKGILSEGFYTAYFRKKAFRTLIIPVKNTNGKVIGVLIFFYFSLIAYLRALKYLKLNASKLHDFLKHLFIIMREYAMDFKNITINQIKDYAILITDPNTHILYANNGALFLLGIPSENLLKGKSFLSFIHNDSIDQFQILLQNLQTMGETKGHLDLNVRSHEERQTIHTQAYLKAISLEDEFMGMYILLHDITNEEILLQNMKRLSAIANSLFSHSDDAIFQVSGDNRIIRSNSKAQLLCDQDMPLQGQFFGHLFPSPLQKKLNQLLDETKTTRSFKEHTEIQFKNRWYNVRTFPVFVEDSYDSSIITFVDITDIKLHEEKLTAITRQMLDDLNAAKTLQYELLPETTPLSEIVYYQHLFQPCEELGGDFYYIEEVSIEGKPYHLIVVADVAGHGISAAMLTVLVKDVYTAFRKSLVSQETILPNRFLDMLNERLSSLEMSTMPFVAVYMGILDIETREFFYSSGGIPFAIRLNSNHEISFLGIEKSPPTGFQSGFSYRYDKVTLHKDDRVIIYTDGIEELLSFYNTYLNNIIMENRHSSITTFKDILTQKIEDFYTQHHHTRYRQDDVTVVLFQILQERGE